MFNHYKIVVGGPKKPMPPTVIREAEEEQSQSNNEFPLPPPGFRSAKRRRIDSSRDGYVKVDDSAMLLELAWAARDVTAIDCPRSKRELGRRLSNNPEQKKTRMKKVEIDGIGEMRESDESPGVILTTSTEEKSESEEGEAEAEEQQQVLRLSADPCLDNQPVTGLGPKLRSGQQKFRHINKLKLAGINVRTHSRPNNAAMIKSPYTLALRFLHHLILSSLARHDFRDAVQLMSLFLLEGYRSVPFETPVQLFRLYCQFCRTIPELRFSDIHVELLQKCYGFPSILKPDIMINVSAIFIARSQIDDALEYLGRLSLTATRTIDRSLRSFGFIRLCSALVLVAKWMIEKEPDSQKRKRGDTIARLAAQLGSEREAVEAKIELDTGIKTLWRSKNTPSTFFLRLILLLNLDTDIDKVLSILEDFSSITPHLPDILELKVLLLQKRSREWDEADFVSSLIHGNDDLDLLVRTTLKYIDAARGEPQSLTIAVQSFDAIPLTDRLRIIFLFLRSNRTFGPAWRLLVDETLGFLGRDKGEQVEADQSSIVEAQTLWHIIDELLGPADKLLWYRLLFDASRTSLFLIRPGDRIFIFLLIPFFASSKESFIDLGYLISASFPSRPPLISQPIGRFSSCRRFLPSTVDPPSFETQQIIRGFELMVEFLFPSSSPVFSINSTELVLLTEVALRLNPPLTISNTTMLASQRWRDFYRSQAAQL